MNTKTNSVLLIEDQPEIREIVVQGLENDGCSVVALANGDQMESVLEELCPDRVILDRGLPGRPGLQLLKILREQPGWTNLPVIMVTGEGDVASRVEGLEAGADDYICKPFAVQELVTRVRTVLRRVSRADEAVSARDESSQAKSTLVHGPMSLDTKSHRVLVNESEVVLTLTEYRILRELILAKDEVVSRRALLERVLGRQDGGERSVDVHVAALRRKIGTEAASTIETVRGVGYRIGVSSGSRAFPSTAS